MTGNLFRIREGKLDQWRAWCARISGELRTDATTSIVEEKTLQELFVIFEVGGTHYTIGLAEGECLPPTDRDINTEHRRISRECLEKIGPIELAYHLKAL